MTIPHGEKARRYVSFMVDQLVDALPLLWFALVAVVLFALWYSGLAGDLLRRIGKFTGFGLSFEFSADGAQQARDALEPQLASLRRSIVRLVEAEVRQRSLQDGFGRMLEEGPLKGKRKYRATIHIQDPLFENALYQLLDYHPRGGGHGRTFSTRSGIIGMAWRTGKYDSWNQSSAITWHDLIRQWGMTKREADEREVADRKKEFLALPLRDPTNTRQVAVLYLDSEEQGIFGTTDDERAGFRKELGELYAKRLASPITELSDTALSKSPQFQLGSL
jgi:hypothetical protein